MDIVKEFMTIFVPLLIIMDPIGNLPFFLLFTEQNSEKERYRFAAVSTLSAGAILIFFSLTGEFILRFFGITLPAFQLAGGFIFFIYSLQMLGLVPSGMKTTAEEQQEGITKENVALVPLAIPLIAGPGAITAVLVWQHGLETASGSIMVMTAVLIACLLIFIVFYFGEYLRRWMGVGGMRVVSRLMGLLLAVIAVQYMVNGFQQIR